MKKEFTSAVTNVTVSHSFKVAMTISSADPATHVKKLNIPGFRDQVVRISIVVVRVSYVRAARPA